MLYVTAVLSITIYRAPPRLQAAHMVHVAAGRVAGGTVGQGDGRGARDSREPSRTQTGGDAHGGHIFTVRAISQTETE
jgi:hypothetical protein